MERVGVVNTFFTTIAVRTLEMRSSDMTTTDEKYLRQLRVLGAWWRLGSSALDPRLLLTLAETDQADLLGADLVAHGGVALSFSSADLAS